MSLLRIKNEKTGKWESIPAFQGPQGPKGDPGTGGGEDLWEHIWTYTEETGPDLWEHAFTEEPDGTPFHFKKLLVRVYSTAAEANGNVDFRYSSSKSSLGYRQGITTAGGVTTVLLLDTLLLKKANGDTVRTLNANVGLWASATAVESWARRGYGSPLWLETESIDNIYVMGNLPIGSTITIYGVRA